MPANKSSTSAALDWRVAVLEVVRTLVLEAAPNAVEERKWKKPSNPGGVPTWSQNGIMFTGETYRDKVKLTFAKGAELPDPAGLFNASLDGKIRRAIDIRESDDLNKNSLKRLIKAAAALNGK